MYVYICIMTIFLCVSCFRRDRDRLVIASKLCFSVDDSDPNARGLSRKHIMNSVERSLKNLQTDYLDLYQVKAELNQGHENRNMRQNVEFFSNFALCHFFCHK